MKIEKMSPKDLTSVASLAEQLGYPNTLENIKTRFQLIQGLEDYALFIAKQDSGKIIGYVQVNREIHTLLAEPRAEIVAIVVDQKERGNGVGSALLAKAEEWAKQHQLRLVRIRSNVKRTDAHRFYENNGYEIPKSWHLFTKTLGSQE